MKSPEEIKITVSVEDALKSLRVRKHARKGRYFCPLHDSMEPTLLASDSRKRANCNVAKCPIKNADIIDLVIHLTGCSFREAIERLETIAKTAHEPATLFASSESMTDATEEDFHALIPTLKPLLKLHRTWLEELLGDGADWAISRFGVRSWRRSHMAFPIDAEERSFCFVPALSKRDQVFYKGARRTLQLFPQRPDYFQSASNLIFCEGELETIIAAWELERRGLGKEWAALSATNAYRSLDKLDALTGAAPLADARRVVLLLPNSGEATATGQALADRIKTAAPDLEELTLYPLPAEVRDRQSFVSFYKKQGSLTAHPFDKAPVAASSSAPVKTPKNTAVINRMTRTAADIYLKEAEQIEYLHTVLCQVGMPRQKTTERRFERSNGFASLSIEAGAIWTGQDWEEQPLPYGTIPRLILVYLSTEAVRTGSSVIDVGRSLTEFMNRLGVGQSGGEKGRYQLFKQQLKSLIASRFLIGMTFDRRAVTIDSNPISKFVAWTHDDEGQMISWPGVVQLSSHFYNSLSEHAVPLDTRALYALKHTSLGLDIYTWLVNRLPRIEEGKDLFLNWNNLYEQFGQDYAQVKDFVKKFKKHLADVHHFYPQARIEEVTDARGYVVGYRFRRSLPVIANNKLIIS